MSTVDLEFEVKVRWMWTGRTIEICIGVIYTLALALVLGMTGESQVSELHLGFWLLMKPIYMAIMLVPYVADWDASQDANVARAYVVSWSPRLVAARGFIMLLSSLAYTAADFTFVGLLIGTLATNCQSGSQCSEQLALYIISGLGFGAMGIVSAIMVYTLLRTPFTGLQPAYLNLKPLDQQQQQQQLPAQQQQKRNFTSLPDTSAFATRRFSP